MPSETIATVIHDLKLWPTYFDLVSNGTKCFEVRRNDRHFRVGDILHLQEWNPSKEEYTGRECFRPVCYVLAGGQFGVEEGFVVLGFDAPPPSVVQHYEALMVFVAWCSANQDVRPRAQFVSAWSDRVKMYCDEQGIPTA